MKKINKFLLILIAVTLTALFCMSLVACTQVDNGDDDEMIYPTNWKTYIDDYVQLMSNTFYLADDGINADLDFEINIFNKISCDYKTYRIVMRLNLSLDKYYNDNALVFEVYKTDSHFIKKKIFSLYSDNTNLYLQVYEVKYNKESKYCFAEAPLLDLMSKQVRDTITQDGDITEFIKKLAANTFTDCTVNSDKTKYNFSFNFATLILGGYFGEVKDILAMLPSELSLAIYNFVGAHNDEEFTEILMNTQAVLVVTREGDCVKQLEINSINNNGNGDSKISNVISNKIVLSKKPIIGLKKAMPSIEGYEKTKIATLTTFGKIALKSTDKLNTLITYDLELNMSIDLLKLMLNNGDIRCLSDDNYFHLSISHKCSSACNDYCSVELGNKFMPSVGSVFDIAFSPSDFGTHNTYVVTSLKSLLSANSVKNLSINANLINLILSDYQLLTIDSSTDIFNNLSSDKTNANSLLKQIVNMLNLKMWGAEIATSDLSEILYNFIPKTELSDTICNILFSNTDVGFIDIECDIPQYGAVRTYDIAKRALFITSDTVDDGVIGTKLYDNALLSSRNLPPLSWSFDDGNYIGNDIFINNIYSQDGEMIYGVKDGKTLPISPEETKSLSGNVLKFSYTDIYNSSVNSGGKLNIGEARILEVLNIDYNNTQNYQKITLKLSSPTRISFSENRFDKSIISALDHILFINLNIYVKLTPIKKNGIIIDRTDKNDNGDEITEYRITSPSSSIKNKVLKAYACIKYVGGDSKTYIVYGNDRIFDTFSSLLVAYMFNVTGDCEIEYKIAGNIIKKRINVQSPDDIAITEDGETTFRIYEKINLSSITTARVNLKYNNPEGLSTNFKISKNRYSIDGRSLGEGSDTWSVSSDGINEYIVFYREGTHTVSVNYLGCSYGYDISVVSEYTKHSTYKVTPRTPADSLFIKGNTYSFYYDLDNKTFGNNGLDNQAITLELHKLCSEGFYKKVVDEEAVIKEMKIDNISMTNGTAIDLPAIIYKPIRILYKISFNKSGSYRLRLYIPSYADDMTIAVNEN